MIIDAGHQQGHEDLPSVSDSSCGGAFGGCDDANIWHGTHVLGVFAARNNSVGVVGAAPGVNDLEVFSWGACPDFVGGECSFQEIQLGLEQAITWGVDVVNISIWGPFHEGVSNSVASAWSADIVLVSIAGNSGTQQVFYPAGYSGVIGVSGVRDDKTFATNNTNPCNVQGSSWGLHVDLAAPYWALSTNGGNTYTTDCGTSFAAPHVAAIAALLRAKSPSLANYRILDSLFNTAEDLGPGGWDGQFGYGLVNGIEALGVLQVTIQGPDYIDVEGTYTWEAFPIRGVTPYSYSWESAPGPSGPWTTVGSAKTYSTYISENQELILRVTVTSSFDPQTATDDHGVHVVMGGGGQLRPQRRK